MLHVFQNLYTQLMYQVNTVWEGVHFEKGLYITIVLKYVKAKETSTLTMCAFGRHFLQNLWAHEETESGNGHGHGRMAENGM